MRFLDKRMTTFPRSWRRISWMVLAPILFIRTRPITFALSIWSFKNAHSAFFFADTSRCSAIFLRLQHGDVDRLPHRRFNDDRANIVLSTGELLHEEPEHCEPVLF